MAFPTITVRQAFANTPLESGALTWSALAAQSLSGTIRRGRQHDLQRIEASTLDLRLNNYDGRLWPSYSGSLVNLCTNPSLEVDTTGWTLDTDAGQTTSRDATVGLFGSASLKVVFAGTHDVNYDSRIRCTVSPSTSYSLSGYIKTDTLVAVGGDVLGMTLEGVWRTGAGVYISAFALAYVNGTTDWTRIASTATSPATAGLIDIQFRRYGGSGGLISGTAWLDGVQLEQASAATDYTDGDQDNCRWSGTAHASTSIRGGPYYPNVLPAKRVNVRVNHGGTDYDVFTGYVERYIPSYVASAGKGPVVDIQASDFYRLLAQMLLNDGSGYSQELSGTRIGNVLDDLGFPALARDLDAGQLTMIASGALENQNALEHLHLIQESELGALFQRGDGYAVFQDGHARVTTPGKDARAMFGDGTALDVGPGATNRAAALAQGNTVIDLANAVNGDGVITSVSIWAATDLTGVEVAMFYEVTSGVFSVRSSDTIGDVTSGSKQTFAVELPCVAGDYLGIWWTGGTLEVDTAGGSGVRAAAGDQIPCYGQAFALSANYAISIEGAGNISLVREIELEMSDDLIFNDVRITRDGGTEQTASDANSQDNYTYRSYQKSNLQMTTDAVAKDMADWILYQRKDARLRVKSMVLEPERDPTDLWPKVLSYDLGTKVWLKLDDAEIDEAYYIEGIEHRFSPKRWQTKYWLSLAEVEGAWILGESALGVETRLRL